MAPARGLSFFLFTAALAAACGRINYTSGAFASTTDAGRRDAGGAPTPDAGLDATIAADGGGVLGDASISVDGCAPSGVELCNGRDDDCDGSVDDGFTRVADPVMCGAPARAGRYSVGGATWDQADSVSSARIVTGAFDATIPSDLFGATLAGFDRRRTLGYLLGGTGDGRALWRTFPEANASPPEPNVDRTVFEAGFAPGLTLVNGPGPDFVVYEINTTEAFGVQVDGSALASPSAWRWEFADGADVANEVNATLFDLDSFGLLAGERVDTIRFRSTFSTEAAQPDRVRDASGEGEIVLGGEPGYGAAFPLLDSPGGVEFTVDRVDTDLVHVVALRAPIPATCCPDGYY
jgi:hypothetical protein